MDITNNERMRLAATAYRAYMQHAAEMDLPLDEGAIQDDILADLIAGLHHYADSRGIGFDSAVASGQAAYKRHRAGEDQPLQDRRRNPPPPAARHRVPGPWRGGVDLPRARR